jgi:hypothetical protein
MFGHKTEEVTSSYRRLLSEELSSPNIIQVIKSQEMKLVGHVAGGKQIPAGFWWGKLTERDSLKDLGIDGRIILN